MATIVHESTTYETVGDPRILEKLDGQERTTAWGPSLAGAVGGFGATIWLATLGAAMGLTAGAAFDNDGGVSNAEATGLGIGAVVWMLLSAIVVGFVGGGLLAWTARLRALRPAPWGFVTWAAGLTLAAIVGSLGSSGAMSSLGAAGGALAAETRIVEPRFDRDATLTEAEAARAAEAAAKAGAATAWALTFAQLVGLATTMFAAKAMHRRFSESAAARPQIGAPLPA